MPAFMPGEDPWAGRGAGADRLVRGLALAGVLALVVLLAWQVGLSRRQSSQLDRLSDQMAQLHEDLRLVQERLDRPAPVGLPGGLDLGALTGLLQGGGGLDALQGLLGEASGSMGDLMGGALDGRLQGNPDLPRPEEELLPGMPPPPR